MESKLLRFASVFLYLCFLSSAEAMSLTDMVTQYRQSVIYIKVQKVDSISGAVTTTHGTGFIVNKDGFVLTAAHVVSSPPNSQVEVRGIVGSSEGAPEGMEVISESSSIDVAVLRFRNTLPQRKPVLIGDPWSLSDDGAVYAMGFPGEEEWFHTEGKLNGKVGPMGSWNTTLTLNPGMSGGPIFDNNGRVVAMVWGGVDTKGITGINRVLPINLLSGQLLIAGAAASPSAASQPPRVVPEPANGIEVSYPINITQDPSTDVFPIRTKTQNYLVTFQARPGYKIVEKRLVVSSANGASPNDGNFALSPDRKTLTGNISITSGTIGGPRGWVHAEVLTRQEQE